MKTNEPKKTQTPKVQTPDIYCTICKSAEEILTFKGKPICKPCVLDAVAMR